MASPKSKSAAGSEIGISNWIDIPQDRINRFAEATCDQQRIRVADLIALHYR
jgi:hypothetical protein